MAKKLKLVDILIGAARRHGSMSDTPDHEVGDLQNLLHLCWSVLTKEQRALIGVAAFDPEGLDMAQWMKPKKIEFEGVTVQRF